MSSQNEGSLFASKFYANLFRKTINISRIVFAISLILKFLIFKGSFEINSISVNILFYTGGLSLVACYLFSMYHHLKERPDWNIAFPELNEGLKVKIKK